MTIITGFKIPIITITMTIVNERGILCLLLHCAKYLDRVDIFFVLNHAKTTRLKVIVKWSLVAVKA